MADTPVKGKGRVSAPNRKFLPDINNDEAILKANQAKNEGVKIKEQITSDNAKEEIDNNGLMNKEGDEAFTSQKKPNCVDHINIKKKKNDFAKKNPNPNPNPNPNTNPNPNLTLTLTLTLTIT
jgi:hypothetical protein